MMALTDQKVVDYRTAARGNNDLHKRLINAMISRGVLTHGKFYFSLAHSDSDIDQVVSILDDALGAVLAAG